MKTIPIAESVRANLQKYLDDLQGIPPTNLHAMLMAAVEKPLLEFVLERTGNNQSLASQWLGIHRNTLRKKMQEQDLLL
ncbi:helix-turn-helix domain-containing protein [Candidatus Symbiobacter mobilis]|uniref:Putative Fis-like DNA-binding protein n=1 Tax=Candidatus Symbiobacter mobilis CR TaxID=946483 RepID=U5N690_9BURK|nr:helix-turn-helix domain-containing protein [Candidatus Symbiobacter mobilis]AGX87036.1 Fis family transcriptional regulator [Candidatus Symbiobacter mobilis CR]